MSSSSVSLTLILLCGLSGLRGSSARAAPDPDGPGYGVKESVPVPRLFAEGVISTVDDDVGGCFSPDGREFYFARLMPYTTYPALGVMCVAHFREGHWEAPQVLPFSGRSLDFPPRLAPDGSRMLFASARPLPDGTRGGVRIWEVARTPSGWGEPHPLPAPINAVGSENADPCLTSDGTLYFSSDRDGSQTVHIYRSALVGGAYAEPEKLGPAINSDVNDSQPCVSPDGKLLIFSSTGIGGPPFPHRPEDVTTGGKPYPRADLYVSVWRDGAWTQARHLEHGINTFAEEAWPTLTPDGRYLFFSSERSPFTVPVERRLTHASFERAMHSPLNGHGNVYFVDVDALDLPR